jgi:protein-S-isoprenylcysteine O-methyltransferase Ste14
VTSRRQPMGQIIDILERLFVVILASEFLASLAGAFHVHPQVVLLAVSEVLSVTFIVLRKDGQVRHTAYAFFIALAGTSLPLLVRPDGVRLGPEIATDILMAAGVCVTIWAKFSLNRSFGIVAANRGVKTEGPYRLVRHPMYTGYFLTQLGFLLACFSFSNLAFYLVAWVLQLLRIKEEESVLMNDATYRSYASRVKWRLMPMMH